MLFGSGAGVDVFGSGTGVDVFGSVEEVDAVVWRSPHAQQRPKSNGVSKANVFSTSCFNVSR